MQFTKCFLEDLLEEATIIHAKFIKDQGASLENCVGFIDCTKNAMSHPSSTSLLHLKA